MVIRERNGASKWCNLGSPATGVSCCNTQTRLTWGHPLDGEHSSPSATLMVTHPPFFGRVCTLCFVVERASFGPRGGVCKGCAVFMKDEHRGTDPPRRGSSLLYSRSLTLVC